MNVPELLHVIEASMAWRLLAAAAIGLAIGIERERQKRHDGQQNPGMRTFCLVALMGGLAAQSGSPLIAGAVLLFVIGLALTARLRATAGRSMTTDIALVIAVMLGILAQRFPGEAIGAAVLVVAVISSRVPLHKFAREWLTERELRDGLLFAVAALVILPLLPDRAIDPAGLFNPFALWRLGVVLMGVVAFSHFAVRILGPGRGLLLSGFAGGFVSSTAVIAALGARVRADARQTEACAAGAAASILGSLIFLIILVAAANPDILQPLTKPFGLAAALTVSYAALLAGSAKRRAMQATAPASTFNIRTGIIFVVLVGGFSLLSWALMQWLGDRIIYLSIISTALLDAHAAAVSVATLVAAGKLEAGAGAFAMLIGFSANMLAKTITAFSLGNTAYGARVTAGLVLLTAGLWLGHAWFLA